MPKVVEFVSDITEQVHGRQRRAEAEGAVGVELYAIGSAVEDVTRQTVETAGTAGQVSNDIRRVTFGAEELSASVGRIG